MNNPVEIIYPGTETRPAPTFYNWDLLQNTVGDKASGLLNIIGTVYGHKEKNGMKKEIVCRTTTCKTKPDYKQCIFRHSL